MLVNGSQFAARDVVFQTTPGAIDLTSCFTLTMLKENGVKTEAVPSLVEIKNNSCIDIAQAIPGSNSAFDFEQRRLKITIPQASMDNQARVYIPPEPWGQGIPALLANY